MTFNNATDRISNFLDKVLRTPDKRSTNLATGRNEGGINNNNEFNNNNNDFNNNNNFQDESTRRNGFEEESAIDLTSESTARTRLASNRSNPLGTSIPIASVNPDLFVTTEQEEDYLAPLPSSNRSSVSSSRGELLSARSTNSTSASVSWGEDPGLSTSKFGVFKMPIDIVEYTSICKKKIGNGTKMCIRKNCTIKHRGDEPGKISNGTILVQKSVDVVFLEPRLHERNITEAVLVEWLDDRKGIDEWSYLFSVANSTQSDEVLSPDELEQGIRFAKDAQVHKSPGLLRASLHEQSLDTFSQLLLDLESAKLKNLPYATAQKKRSYSDDEDLDEPITQGYDKEGELRDAIEHIHTLLSSITVKLDQKDQVMTEEVKMVFTRLEKLQTDLDSRSTGRTDSFQVPTVWGSVALLSGTMEDVKTDIGNCPSKVELTTTLFTEIDRIEASAINTVNLIIVDLESKVAGILLQHEATKRSHEREIARLTKALENSEITNQEIMRKLAEGASVLKDEIDDLR